ncbi:MAG: DUF4886 domain-containing protein [Clostridia bacterium]|nr:DUF4886 domain-containing protein [Clostridia bacterium]
MKILSIGNSFSLDAHEFLHELSEQRGINLKAVNLAIGGCSLQTHWENVVQNNANYIHIINGGAWEEKRVTIEEIIKSEAFDIVTLQQVSHFSGEYETYQPYLDSLVQYVRKYQPNAELYIHRTWAYEIDSQHDGFARYDRDQQKMYKAICEATKIASGVVNAKIIFAGDTIQALRERLPKFDYANGGESLCIDGFHMSHTYGRYAVALTWLATLTGKRVAQMPFKDLDLDIITQICDIVNEIVFEK